MPEDDDTALLVRATGAGAAGDAEERRVAISERIDIGRTCQGVDEAHRLLLQGERVSRNHCHILLLSDVQRAVLVDTSTNGTRVNGAYVERSVPVPLQGGDRLSIGDYELEFVSRRYLGASTPADESSLTVRLIENTRMCVVCGDLVDYTGLSGMHGGTAMFEAMHVLFDELRTVLAAQRGTLYDYVGDALLAVWEHDVFPDAVRRAVAFTRAADERVTAVAPSLKLRRPDGSPLRMGWAVTVGDVASSTYTGSLQGLVGDAVNIGFRLAGLAGRDGRSAILVTEEAYAELQESEPAEAPTPLQVKGRDAPVVVRPLL
ncbi:MAG TPA: adenylate/guanylate cyclase domain-containing protein [Candidatus Dormibacteraeota bacterium]|jgi:class 3 adenylate cyclase|nr:adenylate/guanylate cyclase domain-containing protein [Candidatus Dormibacteraeota bacterium]